MSSVTFTIRNCTNDQIDILMRLFPHTEFKDAEKSRKNREDRINALLLHIPFEPIKLETIFKRIKIKGFLHSRKTFDRDINSLITRQLIQKSVHKGTYSIIWRVL